MKLTDNWKPDNNLRIPLYEQIKVYIRKMISQGKWTIGSRIPSQRYLAKQFEVNRSTVVTAIEDLISEGILESKPKSGIIVKNNVWPLISSTPPDWNSYIRAGSQQPNFDIVRKINIYESSSETIKLGTGELSPDLFPKDLMDVLGKSLVANKKSLGYEHPKGSLELRYTLSDYLKTIGVIADPEQILIVSGVLQAIHLISVGILYKGSTILTENPSYIYSIRVFQSANMKLYGIPMDDNGLIINNISRYKRQRNAAILYTIPSFQNPTGICMSDKRKIELIEKCNEELLPILEDDTYRELYFGSEAPKPLKAFDKNDLVLYLSSMSKTLCPGFRIGWVVGNKSVIDRLADVKMQTDYGSSSLSQIAVNELIKSGRYFDYLGDIRKDLKIRRDITIHALKKYFSDIASWNVPDGGFYVWLNLKNQISINGLFNKCLSKGILINPGNIYQSKCSQHIRISYSYAPYKDLENGLKVLSEIIKTTI